MAGMRWPSREWHAVPAGGGYRLVDMTKWNVTEVERKAAVKEVGKMMGIPVLVSNAMIDVEKSRGPLRWPE